MVTGLAEFAAARLDEEEKLALAAGGGVHCQEWDRRGDGPLASVVEDGHGEVVVHTVPDDLEPTRVHDVARHIALHHPARVLREVAAKRKILELARDATALDRDVDLEFRTGLRDLQAEPYVGDLILRALAAIWDDHPGYDRGWAP